MKTICKFRCMGVEQVKDQTGNVYQENIDMLAVSGPENAVWAKWTPAGQFRISVNNPNVFGQIKVNTDYFITIEESS